MLEPQRCFKLVRAFAVMVLAGAFAALWTSHAPWLAWARMRNPRQGEFGGELSLLRRYHVGPKNEGESNHYIDLWSGNTLPVLARLNNLTNNHALFVDSHGKAGPYGYRLFPNAALLEPGQATPYYSARDLARVVGPKQVPNIHNVLLAGCNAEGRLRASDVRRHFPNATNITYMAPGHLAFKPMYYQAIVLPSAQIRTLYSKASHTNEGRIECEIVTSATPDAQPLGAYLAELYLPSARKPYQIVRASRERLESPAPPACLKGGACPEPVEWAKCPHAEASK